MTGNCLISLIIHIINDNCKIINIHHIDPKFSGDVPQTHKNQIIPEAQNSDDRKLTHLINYSY